jgi:hypothetical protein
VFCGLLISLRRNKLLGLDPELRKLNQLLLAFMARRSSPRSDAIGELTISAAVLERHWAELEDQLRSEMQLSPSDLVLVQEHVANRVTAGFAGNVCEYVDRNLGGRSPVAPLAKIGGGSLHSWLGFHEVWEEKSHRNFAFHHVSLTVHLGYEGYEPKPQIFRSEWPGVRNWSSSGIGFQSPGAGHPHWQFDAVRSLGDAEEMQKEKSLAKLRDGIVVEHFGAALETDVLGDIRQIGLERIHFASAAPWWVAPADQVHGLHMNAPSDSDALVRWAVQCVAYMRQELARC